MSSSQIQGLGHPRVLGRPGHFGLLSQKEALNIILATRSVLLVGTSNSGEQGIYKMGRNIL